MTSPTPTTAAHPDSAQKDHFAIDVPALIGVFDESTLLSDEPVTSFSLADTRPHVMVSSQGEAYVLPPAENRNDYRGYRIIIEKPHDQAVKGRLILLRSHPDKPDRRFLAAFDFHVGGAANQSIATSATRRDFLRARENHARDLWSEGVAGAALFRHLATSDSKELGEPSTRSTASNRRSRVGMDETIQLMSGGRAVSENLQLDVELANPQKREKALIPLSSVNGIRVRAIDWSNRLQDSPTELDELAKHVPHDQYAVFLPSFRDATRIIARAGEIANPIVHWFEPQSRQTNVLGFYQRQLGLQLDAITRQVGGALVDEVAVTGSDPYFRTGTDLAVLMSSQQPELLYQAMLTQASAQAKLHDGVARVEHKVAGQLVTQWSNQNRSFCSIIARFDNFVLISNSLHQTKRILSCSQRLTESMHDLDEYRFFRQRYRRGGEKEAALIVVTDAAIRRWCNPQWRISASRRTRARAAIAEKTAELADDLVQGTVSEMTRIDSPQRSLGIGPFRIDRSGVYSEPYGTLDFQTPIAEMNLTKATAGEIEMYNNWRNRYERRWQRVFDPIALQLSLTENSIAADLSVIPLMLGSEYRSYTQWVGEVRLRHDAGDPHPESLASITMALDTDGPLFQFLRMFLAREAPDIDLFAWIDDSISVYFDEDEPWMKRLQETPPWDFDPTDLQRDLPIGVFLPSKDNLRMAAFLVAARTMIDQFSPNLIRWESAEYRDLNYLVGTVTERTTLGDTKQMPRLCYITTSEGITLSTNHRVIERFIDRHLDRNDGGESATGTLDEAAETTLETNVTETSSLRPQLTMETTRDGVNLMARANYRSGLRRMNRISWSNIPILNYFRHRYPNHDPMDVYKSLFGERLVEPSGGTYRWDQDRGTYVSSLHGFRLEPKAGPAMVTALGDDDQLRTTLSFQDGGLRATLTVRGR